MPADKNHAYKACSDLKKLIQTCSTVYHFVRERLYAAREVRIQSHCGQQEQELMKLTRTSIKLRRLNVASPAQLVRNLTVSFPPLRVPKKASLRPGEMYDNTRVGYASARGLSAILSRINHTTFPRLRNLTIEAGYTADLWDETNHHPHWHIAKALFALKQLTRLRRIKICTRETKDLENLRKATARHADTDIFDNDRACYKRCACEHQRRLEQPICLRIATFFEVMSALLTHNLPYNQRTNALVLEQQHVHSERCKGADLIEGTDELEAWRDKFCPVQWKLETFDLGDLPDELAGVKLGIAVNNVLQNTKGYHSSVGEWLEKLLKELQDRSIAPRSLNLRKRERVNYAGLNSDRAQCKRTKTSPKVTKA